MGPADPAFAGLGRRLSTPSALRGRPTLGTELGVLFAWAALLAMFLREAAARGGTGATALWWCAGGTHGSAPSHAGVSVAAGLPMWTLMSVATMLPAAIPAVRHVAVNSLRWRRRRAMVEFLAVYLGVWLAFGGVLLGLLSLSTMSRTATALVVALALAAGWQLTPQKRRALRACHRSSALPPRGWRATVGVARFGLRNGGACVGSCWALMLVMAVASAGEAPWTLGLAGIVSAEKLLAKPARTNRCAAAALALTAVALGLA